MIDNTAPAPLADILLQIELLDLAFCAIHHCRSKVSYITPQTQWFVQIVKEGGGQKLQVEKTGESFEETLREAWNTWSATARGGLPKEMLGRLIEAPKVRGFEEEIPNQLGAEDDIPF